MYGKRPRAKNHHTRLRGATFNISLPEYAYIKNASLNKGITPAAWIRGIVHTHCKILKRQGKIPPLPDHPIKAHYRTKPLCRGDGTRWPGKHMGTSVEQEDYHILERLQWHHEQSISAIIRGMVTEAFKASPYYKQEYTDTDMISML